MFGDRTKTADGFERTFQLYHLAPFLLTHLLIAKLFDSRAAILQTSTVRGGMVRTLDVNDLDHDHNFSPVRAYNAAKLESVLFTKELHCCYHARRIPAAAFHPGNVATNFGAETTSRLMTFLATNGTSRALPLTAPEKGAAELVRLAERTPGEDWTSGEFYAKAAPAKHLNPLALNPTLAQSLWTRSEQRLARTAPR